METHIITIKPPLQIVDISNGCEAYSASIYIPAKSELMTMIQSITRSQFFLDYNFNYTNVSKFLIWHKTDFATLTPDEIKSLKAKMLKLPTMPMEIFKKVLGNIDKKYPFTLSPKPILVLKLQMTKSPPAVPYHATSMEPQLSTSAATDYKSEPISLEMINRAATDLNSKGVINIKKYKKYLYKPPH